MTSEASVRQYTRRIRHKNIFGIDRTKNPRPLFLHRTLLIRTSGQKDIQIRIRKGEKNPDSDQKRWKIYIFESEKVYLIGNKIAQYQS